MITKLTAHSSPSAHRRVVISEFDYFRLKELVLDALLENDHPPAYLSELEQDLQSARVIPADQIPPYLVTMNTQVGLTDTKTGKSLSFTIVFPGNADIENGNLPILSELGAAILGHCVGDTIQWECLDGRKCMRIDRICFQPEATKQFDL